MFSQRTNWRLTTNALSRVIQQARTAGKPLLDISISNPTEAGIRPDRDVVLNAFADPAMMHYDPQPLGLLTARQAVCNYYAESHAVSGLDPQAVMLATSTSEAYSYIFKLLCNAGDEVLVPKPSYPLFEFLADLADVKLVPYPLLYDHGWQIDFDSLEKTLTKRARAIILVHPNNPTGSYVASSEQETLNELCRRHALALIVDEVFLDYSHEAKPRRSFVENHESLTFTLSGISKISALPQMKFAWAVITGPAGVVAEASARLEVIADTFLSMNAPVQLAAPVLLDQRKVVQPKLLNRLRQNLTELDRQLERAPSSRRLSVDGGWYAVLRVPVVESDEELAVRLVEIAGVIVHPGHFYDFPTDGYLVLSLIADPVVFRSGLKRLLEFLM